MKIMMETRRKIAKILALVVSVAGILVIFGWVFDLGLLKSLSPAWISMKFNTAVVFVLSGLILYFVARTRKSESDAAQVVLPIASLVILLLMGTLFLSTLFGVHTGAEELFVRDSDPNPTMVIPGGPSLPTMFNFILIAVAAILTTFNPKRLTLFLKIIGLTVGGIGAVAVSGYLANVPYLYYFVASVNNAMACNTAILFMFLGVGLLCL